MQTTTALPGASHSRQDNANSTAKQLCRVAIRPLRRMLPLSARKEIIRRIARGAMPGRVFLAMELLDDIAQAEPESFHRFLWRHHLGYARSYEPRRFGAGQIEPSRRMLFQDIRRHLRERGITPEKDVQSIFDAGCSLGYLLRFAETEMFPSATVLRGLDLDEYAIKTGTEYLQRVNSKIELSAGDMSNLEQVMGQRSYDVVWCSGVLLYFEERTAERILGTLLRHTRLVLGLISLAHPSTPNHELRRSEIRARDGVRIHNVDALVRRAGGRVVFRRWNTPEARNESSPPYFLLAEPGSPD